MRSNIETYKIWAPDNVLWTEWVKPVVFAKMGNYNYKLNKVPIDWHPKISYNTMLILDLPNERGIEEGIALARIGYRPIPLYNGVKGPNYSSQVISVEGIEKALYAGADELTSLYIKADAPPAFLLDSRRLNGLKKEESKYDNRWSLFPQDMPSATYLIKKGISEIIVRSSEISCDLSHILCRYQEQNIKILLCDDKKNIKEVKVSTPPRYKSWLFRFFIMLGLTSNSTGGFGGKIPDQTQSGGMG